MLRRLVSFAAIVLASSLAGFAITYFSPKVVKIEESTSSTGVPALDEVLVILDEGQSSRREYAEFIRKLNRYEVAGLYLDFFFADIPEVADQLPALEKAIADARFPVATNIGSKEEGDPVTYPELFKSERKGSLPWPKHFSLVTPNGQRFKVNKADGTEDESMPVTGVLAWERVAGTERVFPHAAVWFYSTWRKTTVNAPDSVPLTHDTSLLPLTIGGKRIELRNGELPVFATTEKVTTWMLSEFDSRASFSSLQGKFVILGRKADQKVGPTGETEFGPVIIAQSMSSLAALLESGAKQVSSEMMYGWLVLCASLCVFFAGFRAPWLGAAGCLAVLTLATLSKDFFEMFGFRNAQFIAPMVTTIFATAIAFVTRSLYAGQAENEGRFEIACLFFDMAHSTRIENDLGSAQASELKKRLIQLFSLEVERRGGLVESSQGDGFYARFRKRKVEQATKDAIHASLSALRQLELHKQDFEQRFGVFPEVRIAVESGVAEFKTVHTGKREVTTSGACVNLAARLLAVAKEHSATLVIGPGAASHFDGPMKSLGNHDIRGFETPIEVFTIERT